MRKNWKEINKSFNLANFNLSDGATERHRYFNDREKLLKGKDLRIFVTITDKSYFF